jgi:hypothetical protein
MESWAATTGPRYRPLGANLLLLQIKLSGGGRLPRRCCRHWIASGDVESKGKNGGSVGCPGGSALRPRSVLRNLLSYESSRTRLRTRAECEAARTTASFPPKDQPTTWAAAICRESISARTSATSVVASYPVGEGSDGGIPRRVIPTTRWRSVKRGAKSSNTCADARRPARNTTGSPVPPQSITCKRTPGETVIRGPVGWGHTCCAAAPPPSRM